MMTNVGTFIHFKVTIVKSTCVSIFSFSVKDTNYYLIAIGITLLLVVILLVPLVSMIILWKRKKLR